MPFFSRKAGLGDVQGEFRQGESRKTGHRLAFEVGVAQLDIQGHVVQEVVVGPDVLKLHGVVGNVEMAARVVEHEIIDGHLALADQGAPVGVEEAVAAFLPGPDVVCDASDGAVDDVEVMALDVRDEVQVGPVDARIAPGGLFPERVRQGETEVADVDVLDQQGFSFPLERLGVPQVEDALEVGYVERFRDQVETAVPDRYLVEGNVLLAGQALEREGDGRDPDAGDGVPGLEEGSGERVVVRQHHVPQDQGLEGQDLHAADGELAVDLFVDLGGHFPGNRRLDAWGLQQQPSRQEQEQQRSQDARDDMFGFGDVRTYLCIIQR